MTKREAVELAWSCGPLLVAPGSSDEAVLDSLTAAGVLMRRGDYYEAGSVLSWFRWAPPAELGRMH